MEYSGTEDTGAPIDPTDIKPVRLRGIKVYPFDSAARLIDFADNKKGILVAINAEKILNAREPIKKIIEDNIPYCDGGGAVLAARQKGTRPAKIAGCDLWLEIIDRFHADRTFYFIGAKEEIHHKTIEKITALYPDIKILGHRNGYFTSQQEKEETVDDVVKKKPDFVFVAMGSPAQEIFMAQMLEQHKAVYQGLGGSFDVFVGREKRAPKWWQDHSVEFAYRLMQRPERFRRNLKYIKFAWWLLTRRF